jgi:hypothetical protein
MYRLAKKYPNRLSYTTIALLGLCLVGLALHVFVDGTGHANAWIGSHQVAEHGGIPDPAESLDHEDDYFPLKSFSPNAMSLVTLETILLLFSVSSLALSPLLLPPIAN